MKKIVTILCAFIFSINLSANAAMISVNEDSVLFSESNEEMGENDKKIYEELYENNEVENKELTSDSEVEKMDNDILLYDESINIETENKNFMIQEQKDELKEEVAIFDISTDGKITLQPNKTYEFINSSDEMVSVFKRSEQEVRYHILMYSEYGISYSSIYDKDGFSIYPNGKTKIKIISAMELKLEIDYKHIDSIILKELNTPVFEEFILEKDKIYELTNDTNKSLNIKNDTEDNFKFNYIKFDEDGYRRRFDFNVSCVPDVVRETMLLEVDKKSTSQSKLYIPYEYKNKVKISDGKVFNKINIEKNKSYTIKNNSNSTKEVYFSRKDDKRYTWDSVSYNENGDSVSIEVGGSTINKHIYSYRTEKMTFSEECYLYTLYKDLLDIKQVSTPAIYNIELITGKSYELTNKSSNKVAITSRKYYGEDSKYDVVMYDEEGNVKNIYYNEGHNPLDNLRAYSRSKILKTKGSNEVIVIPYDEKDLLSIKELNTPVIYNTRIKNGEVYEFTNNGNGYVDLDLITSNQDIAYDYIGYFPDSESVSSVEFDSQVSWKTVQSQQKIKLSVTKGEYLDLLVPYELKDGVKKLSTPMFQKIEVKKGNSYEVKTSKYTVLYIKDKNYEFRYDYVKYNNDDDEYIDTTINEGGNLYMMENCTYRIATNRSNVENIEFYIPYENRTTVTELNHPLIKTIILDNKNNYEIVNKMGRKCNIILDEDSIGKEYEFIEYDKDDNIKEISEYSRTINCDGKVRISVAKDNNLTLYVPYDFQYELNYINNPIIFKKDILPNKTYEISNSYVLIKAVTYPEEFEIIQYGANGEIVIADHSNSGYLDYENIKGITKIRLTNGEKIELLLPYENRNNIKETNDLLFKKISLQKNKEYKIYNNNSFDIIVDTDINWSFSKDRYKITYYDSKGYVKETLYDQYGGFKIKDNESAKISINSDGYNMYVPYEATIVDDDSESDSEKPIVGDFNNDGKVDILDLSMLATKYNKQKGETGWDSTYDLNNDFIIDLFDLSIVAKKL